MVLYSIEIVNTRAMYNSEENIEQKRQSNAAEQRVQR